MHHPIFPNIRMLNVKFLIIVLPPVIIGTILLTVFSGIFICQDLKQSLISDVHTLIHAKNKIISSELWNYNIRDLQQDLKVLTLYPGISQAVVRNTDGKIIAEARASYGGIIPRNQGEITQTLSIDTLYEKKKIGTLIVSYHYEKIYGRLIQHLLEDLLRLLLLVVVIVTSAILANRFTIGIPLKRFLNAVRYAQEKNIRKTVDWPTCDELGRVVDAYNTLLVRLAEREDELRDARDAAESANRAKSIFIANMSHEFRTPLNAILGFSQLIRRNSRIPEETQETLGIISRSGEHLLTLINQVLDFSKIEAGEAVLNETDFDLFCLLDDITNPVRLRAEKKGLSLISERSADLPQYIRTDEAKLRQVLISLLRNAIKFTKEGGVSLRVSGRRDDRHAFALRFEVEDSGPGISPDETENLFRPFTQTQVGEILQEGTGLGLTISRKFVQLMGGEITVRSEVGRGTVFSFHIQAVPVQGGGVSAGQSEPRITPPEPAPPCYRILIADDKADNRQLIRNVLTPLRLEFREAENGQEALEMWQEWRPHLIWMAIRMPVMDGYEAIRRIREADEAGKSRIIAVITSVCEEERAAVLAAGCDDFLCKPFREADIFELIQKYAGVCYAYDGNQPEEHEEATKSGHTLTAEALSELPPDMLGRLEQAALRADIRQIAGLVLTIRSFDTDLADALAVLADDFEYEKIIEYVREADKFHD